MQQQMFGPEVLPLFSGQAPRVPEERFAPKPQARQLHLGVCPVCEDTGLVVVDGQRRRCTCPAGQGVTGE
jgi:hypothetical protein